MNNENQTKDETDEIINNLMKEYGVDSPEKLAGIEVNKQLKGENQINRRYNIKIAFQFIGIAIVYFICVFLLVKILSFWGISSKWWIIIAISIIFGICFFATIIKERKDNKKHKTEIENTDFESRWTYKK